MLHYPKNPGSQALPGGRGVAFEKYDGTNLHWCWDRDFDWHAVGTRRDEFNLTADGLAAFAAKHAHLREASAVFDANLAGGLDAVFRTHPDYVGVQEFKAFAEFFGPTSFAGLHVAAEPKELRLFDVWADPAGFVGPSKFVADFGHLNIARVVHQGKLTGQFAADVRAGRHGVGEGVVCKGGTGGTDIWMAKIKTDAYLARLKTSIRRRLGEALGVSGPGGGCFAPLTPRFSPARNCEKPCRVGRRFRPPVVAV